MYFFGGKIHTLDFKISRTHTDVHRMFKKINGKKKKREKRNKFW